LVETNRSSCQMFPLRIKVRMLLLPSRV
jgi:hypothetical protein